MSKRVLSTQCHGSKQCGRHSADEGWILHTLIVYATARGRKGILIVFKQPRVTFFFTNNDRKVASELIQRVRVFGSKREDPSS